MELVRELLKRVWFGRINALRFHFNGRLIRGTGFKLFDPFP
jgi:hypothetical protein